MNHSPPPPTAHRAATSTEIGAALDKFVEVYPGFEDNKLAARMRLLVEAVQGQPIWAIRRAVDDFVFGVVDRKRPDVMPQPYELRPHVLKIVESGQRREALVNAAASGGKGRAYAAPVPQSRMIAEGIRKDEVRALIDGMGYGPGCIWHPGSYGENAEFGDLYEPDPKWRGPSPVAPTKQEQDEAARQRTNGERLPPEEYAAVRERAAHIINRSLRRRPPGRSPTMTAEERERLSDDLLRWQHEAAAPSITEPRD